MSLFGDFEYHLQISVGIYIPNSWVMFNWDIYQPLKVSLVSALELGRGSDRGSSGCPCSGVSEACAGHLQCSRALAEQTLTPWHLGFSPVFPHISTLSPIPIISQSYPNNIPIISQYFTIPYIIIKLPTGCL